jgi:hypothetical protein
MYLRRLFCSFGEWPTSHIALGRRLLQYGRFVTTPTSADAYLVTSERSKQFLHTHNSFVRRVCALGKSMISDGVKKVSNEGL